MNAYIDNNDIADSSAKKRTGTYLAGAILSCISNLILIFALVRPHPAGVLPWLPTCAYMLYVGHHSGADPQPCRDLSMINIVLAGVSGQLCTMGRVWPLLANQQLQPCP